MKLKEFFYLLGLKPKPRVYGSEVRSLELARDGRIEVAQWLHPGAYTTAPSQADVDEIRTVLAPGDLAVDIGANTGDSTMPMALAVGPTGLVLALEPNGYVYPVLARNAALNADKTNIVPLPYAAMREDGAYEFQYGGPGYCNGGYHEGVSRWTHASAFPLKVQGRNLARYLAQHYADRLPRLRFIKVDAEGFDLAILETLADIVDTYRPFLQVEFFAQRKTTPRYREDLYQFLVSRNYDVHHVEGTSHLRGTRVTPDNLMSWSQCDVFGVPRPAVTG